MKLTLSISMCPSGSNMEGQQYHFGPEGGTFGRSADNAWVLPDLSRHVSSIHARISVEHGQFILNDLSTNGLFLNGSTQALGPNKSVVLSQGDQLTLGDYCVQVLGVQTMAASSSTPNDPDATHLSSPVPSSPYVDDLDKWLEPAVPSSQPLSSSEISFNAPLSPQNNSLGDIDLGLKAQETDPLAVLGGANLNAKPSNSDSGALSDLLGASAPLDQQMMKVPNVIPSDWDDLLGGGAHAQDAPQQQEVKQEVLQKAQQKVQQPELEPDPEKSGSVQLNTAGQGEYKADQEATHLDPISDPLGLRELLSTPTEQLKTAQDTPVEASSLQATRPQPVSPEVSIAPTDISPTVIPDKAISQSATQSVSDASVSSQTSVLSDQAINLAQELGLDHLSEAQLATLETAVANTVKETVSGMMKTLRARSEIKSEFRLNMTTIQSAENNPLKFSVTPEDAIENMFAKQGKAYLSPIDAINDGFADISDHQVALFDAMKAAYEHIFSQFDPEFLSQKFQRTSGKRFLGGKVKNWDAYQLLYSEYKEDNEQTFKRLFGEVFADAYERRMHSLKMSRGHSSNK